MNENDCWAGGFQHIVSREDHQLERIEEGLRLYWRSVLDEPLPAEILMLISVLARNERDYSDPVRRSV